MLLTLPNELICIVFKHLNDSPQSILNLRLTHTCTRDCANFVFSKQNYFDKLKRNITLTFNACFNSLNTLIQKVKKCTIRTMKEMARFYLKLNCHFYNKSFHIDLFCVNVFDYDTTLEFLNAYFTKTHFFESVDTYFIPFITNMINNNNFHAFDITLNKLLSSKTQTKEILTSTNKLILDSKKYNYINLFYQTLHAFDIKIRFKYNVTNLLLEKDVHPATTQLLMYNSNLKVMRNLMLLIEQEPEKLKYYHLLNKVMWKHLKFKYNGQNVIVFLLTVLNTLLNSYHILARTKKTMSYILDIIHCSISCDITQIKIIKELTYKVTLHALNKFYGIEPHNADYSTYNINLCIKTKCKVILYKLLMN